MTVPLQSEGGQAKLDRGADFVLRRLIDCQLPNRIDLPISMAFILRGMELVSFCGARREAIVRGELAINFFGDFPCAAQLALDEREHSDAFQSGATLATANDHLDRGKRPRSGFGGVRLFTSDAAFFEKLQ